MPAVIDLTKNENQADFFNAVMSKVGSPDSTPKKVFAYGGAIRGGKTYVCLFILACLCRMFPNSRWHVIRSDFPALRGTSIPSMQKLLGQNGAWRWTMSPATVTYLPNNSKIFFMGESLTHDPNLHDFLGMETNGIMLEQAEELSEKLFNIAISRAGSWYIDPMPPGLILTTFNPAQTWIKTRIFEPYRLGTLPDNIHFQLALPKDNPFVTKDQWEGWAMMDDRYKRQFIDGDWTDFDGLDNRWAYAFSREKHLGLPEPDPTLELILSFDFNRNPMACSVIQFDGHETRVLKVYKIPNMGASGLCERILVEYPNFIYMVTGDYTGDTATTLFEEQVTNYTVIQNKLGITDRQIRITPNPLLRKNRTLVNSVLQNLPVVIHKEDAKALIYDLENVKSHSDGALVKTDRDDPAQQADALDTFRYYCNIWLHDFIHIPTS